MSVFAYAGRSLQVEEVALEEIARGVGTPCYVYSGRGILRAYRAWDEAFRGIPHAVCYAVKANSTLAVLGLLAKAGAGFDIVSGGELFRVLRAGGDARRVVFSGVGKTAAEMEYALAEDIGSFNCESEGELELLDSLAGRAGKKARFALRVNPDVNAATHPYISTGMRDHKFGIDIREAESVYRRARRCVNLIAAGVSCHIGSQMLDTEPMVEAAEKVLALADRLRAEGHPIEHVDIGGGLGVAYRETEKAPEIEAWVARLRERLLASSLTVTVEPGRSIVGPAGVLLTRVLGLKENAGKKFLIVDAAMNDLIRPSLYGAHHEILPLRKAEGSAAMVADVVGPVCESGDFLARGRELPEAVPGDFLALMTAGAYGFVQSSNYNSRPRAAEVLVEGSKWRVVRERETLEDLVRGEMI